MPEEVLEKRIINPHEQATLSAGEFDTKTRTPKIVLQLNYPQSVKNLVSCREELAGTEPHCSKIFTIHNQSNFLVYARLVKQSD
jgi:hypothetical protein